MANQHRVPPGSPEGGQFAKGSRSESSIGEASLATVPRFSDHPQFKEVRDRLEMEMSADPMYSERVSELLDRLDQEHLSDDSRAALTRALEALDADPEDEDSCNELGKALLRDCDHESNDPSERRSANFLRIEDAIEAGRDDTALAHVHKYAPEGYIERMEGIVSRGRMSAHTKSIIDAGVQTDDFAYGTNISNALLRDSFIAEIDPDKLETFRRDAIAAPRQYNGMVRADFDQAFEEMDYAEAAQLRDDIAKGDEMSIRMAHSRLGAAALSKARERTLSTARGRLKQEVLTMRPGQETPLARRDDVMDVIENPRDEVDEACREAADAALGDDSAEAALQRGAQAAIAQAARRTRERNTYLSTTLKAQMDQDLDRGKRSFRMDSEAREMIASGSYSQHTRDIIDSARMPYAESQRGDAIEALSRDAVLSRCEPSDRGEVVNQVGREAYDSMPREAAQRLERRDISGAIDLIRNGKAL